MSEQNLNRAEICAGIEQMGRAGVAKQVGMDAALDAGALARLEAEVANRAVVQRRTRILPGREQPILWPLAPEVNAQSFEQNRGEPNLTRNTALSLAHMQHHALAVDIADLEVLHFAASQPRRVESGQDGPMLQVAGRVEHPRDFLRAQNIRQTAPPLRLRYVLRKPALFQRADVKESESGAVHHDGVRRRFFIPNQMQ